MAGSAPHTSNWKTCLHYLKPILRAYALGYVSVTGPKLFGLPMLLKRKDVTIEEMIQWLRNILKTSTEINRFPTSCAIITGGATLLPRFVTLFYLKSKRLYLNGKVIGYERHIRLIRIICTFLSALLAFRLLNRDDGRTRNRASSGGPVPSAHTTELQSTPHRPAYHPPRLAGRTIDLTLFSSSRALSVMAIALWTRTQSSLHHPSHTNSQVANLLTRLADPAIFATSAALVMHAWFYSPSRLPRSYNHWIHKAANIDPRFLRALRHARSHTWVYGTTNTPEMNNLLRGVAQDLHLPEEWGDPSLTVPVRCELIHAGCGPSCELHALWRFYRAWLLGMEMYLPFQLAVRLLRKPTIRSLLESLAAASRSATFLGSFISLFYYGVCLARTRLGPLLLPPDNPYCGITPQRWDGGLCILSGCVLCGWSILLEEPKRRAEVAFFVLPRAMATLLPRVYDRRLLWREGVVFAASAAVVLDAVASGKGERVRGVLGKFLGRVLV